MNHNNQNNFVTPEQALKRADEQGKLGNWKVALEHLKTALMNRRNRGNSSLLEKLMVQVVYICIKDNNSQGLKDNLQNFRNSCQHTSMSLLESVFKHLMKENKKLIEEIEAEEGSEKITQLLQDEQFAAEDRAQNLFQMAECNATDLILLANCDIEKLEERARVMPRLVFYMETYKIILDTLRQNSRLLDLYNKAATNLLTFCCKHKCTKEFKRVSTTLHIHFEKILEAQRVPEMNAKIPYPVLLNDEESTTRLLAMRHTQLEYALQMEEWQDAYRTSEVIYNLINTKKERDIKAYLESFFQHLAAIFWKSENVLFHTYALQNLQKISIKNVNKTAEYKQNLTVKLMLAALSTPLNGKICNYQRLATAYLPKDLKDEVENSPQMRAQILAVSGMLQISGLPSRKSLFNALNLKNSFIVPTCPQVKQLYKLIEQEESPFKISKSGCDLISAILEKFPELEEYRTHLKRTLAIRVLQKCKNFYTNTNFKTLNKHLSFYGSSCQIEQLIYECNRQGLITVSIDHRNEVISYDYQLQLAQNLTNFGHKLRDTFTKIAETKTQGQERMRIFVKVKEKIDEETQKVQVRKEAMRNNKEQLTRDLQKEMEEFHRERARDEQTKIVKFQEQQLKEATLRQRNELMDTLMKERQFRAREILNELSVKGIKKVGKDHIQALEQRDDLDYDLITDVYQALLKREREYFDVQKNKKVNDVEIWSRALREEEKIAMGTYCEKHGAKEMEDIAKAIREKHAKELATKQMLVSAKSPFERYREALLAKRREEHQEKQRQFSNQVGEKAKEEMLVAARKQLTLLEVKRLNEAAAEQRRQKAMAIEKKEKAENKGSFYYNDNGEGWGRGSAMDEAKKARQEDEMRFNRDRKPRDRPMGEEGGNDFRRATNLRPKEEGSGMGGGFISRDNMKARDNQEEGKQSGKPTFTSSRAPQTFNRGGEQGNFNRGGPPREGGEGNFNRGGPPREGGEGNFNRGGPPREGGEGNFNRGGPPREGGEGNFNRGGPPREGPPREGGERTGGDTGFGNFRSNAGAKTNPQTQKPQQTTGGAPGFSRSGTNRKIN